MAEIVRCGLRSCNKVLTDDMEIEYSHELNEFFCSPDHAKQFYFDYMMSAPLDVDAVDGVYFKDGILHKKT